jgi:hypothetical protein
VDYILLGHNAALVDGSVVLVSLNILGLLTLLPQNVRIRNPTNTVSLWIGYEFLINTVSSAEVMREMS